MDASQDIELYLSHYEARCGRESAEKIALSVPNIVVPLRQRLNARLLLVGDRNQLPAINAGKPFILLQQAKLPMAQLTEIHRQQTPALLTAVNASIHRQMGEALHALAHRVIKEPDYNQCIEQLAKAYIQQSPAQRAQTLVMTPAHVDRLALNQAIRCARQENGELSSQSHTLSILVKRSLTQVEYSRVSHYVEGNVLCFRSGNKALNIAKNSYVTVKEILPKRNALVLEHQGQQKLWRPQYFAKASFCAVDVYETDTREVAINDIVRWTQSDPKRGLLGSEFGVVTAISKQQLCLRWDNGKTLAINPKQHGNQHWEFGYVTTSYVVQGKTCTNALVLCLSYRKRLTNQLSFIVNVSRATQDLRIYTDDEEKLCQQLTTTSGDKSSALAMTDPTLQSVNQVIECEHSVTQTPLLNKTLTPITTQAPSLAPPTLDAHPPVITKQPITPSIPHHEHRLLEKTRDEEPELER